MDEHIRIGDVAPRVQYAADGVQTAFPYPFPIFEPDDLEVRFGNLVQRAGFVIAGAGDSDGGIVTFASAPAPGMLVTLRRNLVVARTSDFQENGILRARTLNDELDYQVAALQEVKEELGTAIRLDPSEVGTLTALPLRAARANRLLAFDSVGDVTVFDRREGTVTLPFPGGVPRSVEDKFAESLSARDFGAVGDGAADDGPALQAALNAASATGRHLEINEGTFRTTMPLRLASSAAGLTMRGSILYAGPGGQAALTIGDGGTVNTQGRSYLGLSVIRATQSDWLSEGDVGIRLFNIDACTVEVRRAERFTIGLQLAGDGRGCEDSTIHLHRLIDNRIGLDCRTLTASAWMNSLRFIGGHFACSAGTNPAQARFGVRLSAAPGAYTLHNAHAYFGPAFELQRQGTPGTVDAIPFLLEVDGRALVARSVRMEACSPFVARHTGAFNDAVYEVAFVGTYGFLGAAVDYPAGATRAGGTVLPLHQAAAAHGTPRLVAAAEHVRSRAFRQTVVSLGGVGFDGMAVLSGNPSGPPSTLNGFCFPGLTSIGLNADSITLPTSRALGFVVECGECKEFFIAAEGAQLRPVVLQFDAAENVLGDTSPVLFSNMNTVWAGSPSFFHEGNADLDSLTGGLALNRLQRVTLHASARFAVIGVRGGVAGAELKALRLFAPALCAPMVLSGGGRAWGQREYTASIAWTVPSLGPGATATADVTLPGVRQGDFVAAGFARSSGFWNGGLIFHASVGGLGGADQVRVTVQNITGGTIAGADGTLFVRATKPRL
ncbi:MAG: hydrolase [Acetobacteraceae bacterium]|nr:hydrolase [Acetobacteraceae bacterium]